MIHAFTAYQSLHIKPCGSPAPFVCTVSCLCCGFQLQSVCWGRERGVFSVLECTVPNPSPRRVAGWQGKKGVRPRTLNCGWHRSRSNALEVGRGVQIHACFMAWTERGEEHKWHRGEEVGNIILKCTDKSACASTDRAASNTWCFLYICPPPRAGTYRHPSPTQPHRRSRDPKTQISARTRPENAHIPKTANRPLLRITCVRAAWGHSHLVKFYYLCICLAQFSIAPFDVNCCCCSRREMNRRSVAPTALGQDEVECIAKESIWTVICSPGAPVRVPVPGF